MRPKNQKDIINDVAEELKDKFSEQLVKDVVNSYYQEVRDQIAAAKSPRIFVHGLMTFYVKPWVLEKELTETKDVLAKFEDPNCKRKASPAYYNSLKAKLARLESHEEKYGYEKLKKDRKKIQRKKYDKNKQAGEA